MGAGVRVRVFSQFFLGVRYTYVAFGGADNQTGSVFDHVKPRKYGVTFSFILRFFG